MQLLMVKPHEKKNKSKKEIKCDMSPLYIFYLQRIKSMLKFIYTQQQKRLFTIYTILMNLREEWLCTEQRSRNRGYGIRLKLVIVRWKQIFNLN